MTAQMARVLVYFAVLCARAAAVGINARPASSPVIPGSTFASTDTTKKDLMVRAALGLSVERTPVWLFRQAGRHLPEYKRYKETRGKNFLQLLDDPRDVAEVTLQPLRRYDLDAAILFSDILVVPQALGMEVTMPGGKGIQMPSPLQTAEDAVQLLARNEDMDVRRSLSHVLEAVSLIREQQEDRVPLIGFSAAPWTLFYYMVGGSMRKNTESGERWLSEHTKESLDLMQLLTSVVIEYLCAQIDSGAQLVQVFEAMGEHISRDSMKQYALPCMRRIVSEVKQRHPDVPVMIFSRDATYCNADLLSSGYDVVTLDCTSDRKAMRSLAVTAGKALQGNLDPVLLRRGEGGTEEQVVAETERMLREMGPDRLIANLGSGLMGTEDPALCKAFVDAVHTISEDMLR